MTELSTPPLMATTTFSLLRLGLISYVYSLKFENNRTGSLPAQAGEPASSPPSPVAQCDEGNEDEGRGHRTCSLRYSPAYCPRPEGSLPEESGGFRGPPLGGVDGPLCLQKTFLRIKGQFPEFLINSLTLRRASTSSACRSSSPPWRELNSLTRFSNLCTYSARPPMALATGSGRR